MTIELQKFQLLPLCLAVSVVCGTAAAQSDDEVSAQPEIAPPPGDVAVEGDASAAKVEEVVVLGRFISSSEALVNERMNDAFATDLLGAETIGRLGDSTVGAALRRVPGLTLVKDKYVYIRGLGERYTTTTLNGAYIPSPDLTRNVIPLDVFPTSIVQSLKVQKSYSPALSANFGGGAVDIRTKGVPESFSMNFEVGVGHNTENPSEMMSYEGGGDDFWGVDDGTRELSSEIQEGIVAYQGRPNVNSILYYMDRQDPTSTLHDASTENRNLGAALYRDIGLEEESADPDWNIRGSVGDNFLVGSDWELGYNVGGSYDTDWRFTRTRTAFYGAPDQQYGIREESTRAVNIAGTLNLGAKFLDDHEISTTTLFLRNTDDETEVYDFFNADRLLSDGIGFRDYRLQFEEREMVTNQINGQHILGESTRSEFEFIDKWLGWVPMDTQINWFWSDSNATTDIPNQVDVSSDTVNDRTTGAVLSEAVQLNSEAGDYRFTELDDEVRNYGWSAMVPLEFSSSYLQMSGGYDHAQKARTYKQSEFTIGFLSVSDPSVLQGTLDDVFSDENIYASVPDPTNPAPGATTYVNNFVFDRVGANTDSYIAATMTDSVWGAADWTFADTWRFAAGARWEDYRQVGLTWNPYGFSQADPQITTDPEVLEDGTFMEDQVYPAASVTYIGDLWAETFQLRLGYSETAVRPDLREITTSSYIDPITDDLVRGNAGIVPADVENIDLRAEWFFSNGDNFTVTLYQKDIEQPIEFFEIAASDTTIAREVLNAESAEVQGVEFEALKELAFLGGIFDTLFVQGNLTFQDSELVAGPFADAPTNPVRPLTGASEYVVNVMLGFDSRDARHTASLIYNVFGERLFVAGRNGEPDGYEQPFHSLDFTYFWYPTENLTFKVKAQNLLGETITIERAGATVFEEDPGTVFSIAFALTL
jgi:TonB-dependent receptor